MNTSMLKRINSQSLKIFPDLRKVQCMQPHLASEVATKLMDSINILQEVESGSFISLFELF